MKVVLKVKYGKYLPNDTADIKSAKEAQALIDNGEASAVEKAKTVKKDED